MMHFIKNLQISEESQQMIKKIAFRDIKILSSCTKQIFQTLRGIFPKSNEFIF